MPAKPSYCHLLSGAIAELEALDTDWVGRSQLQEALGVSKTVAWRVFKKCGAAQGPGGSLLLPREELIRRLGELARDGNIHEREIRRRDKLADYLENARPDVLANLRKVARGPEAVRLLSTTFRKLPANVSLKPTSLHIEFFGTEDFLQAVGSVVYALHNDFEEVSLFIEEGLAAPRKCDKTT